MRTAIIIRQYDIKDKWNFDIRNSASFVLSKIIVGMSGK